MTKPYLLLILLALGLSFSPGKSFARVLCPEGRTFAGTCVNPNLAASARMRAIVMTQIELSKTAPPYMPSDDRKYWLPFNVFEMFRVLLR
jgi:hypothetical protein